MNGLGCVNASKSYKMGIKQLDIAPITKYIREIDMKDITLKDWVATLFLMTPVIATLAFATYKLALEIWCIAYGLIY